MHLLGQVETAEWQGATKLMEYGLRITSIYQILDGRVPRELLNQSARSINPDICRQGKTPSRAPLATPQERLLTTLVTKLYQDLRQGLPSISMAEAVAHLYEEAWNMAKSPVFKRPFNADEIYAIVRSVSNGQILLTVCKGTPDTYHHNTDFAFVVDREEPIKGLCPWCAASAKRSKKVTAPTPAKDTTATVKIVNG